MPDHDVDSLSSPHGSENALNGVVVSDYFSVDFDGAQNSPTDEQSTFKKTTHLQANKAFINFAVKEITSSDKKRAVVMNGSNRQHPSTDSFNINHSKSNSVFPCVNWLQQGLSERIAGVALRVNVSRDGLLLTDSAGSETDNRATIKRPGDLFNKILPLGEETNYDNTKKNDLIKDARKLASDNNYIDVFDEQKALLLWQQMMHAAVQSKDAANGSSWQVNFHFFDDRADILNALQAHFKKHPCLIPKGVTLHLHAYTQGRLNVMWEREPNSRKQKIIPNATFDPIVGQGTLKADYQVRTQAFIHEYASDLDGEERTPNEKIAVMKNSIVDFEHSIRPGHATKLLLDETDLEHESELTNQQERNQKLETDVAKETKHLNQFSKSINNHANQLKKEINSWKPVNLFYKQRKKAKLNVLERLLNEDTLKNYLNEQKNPPLSLNTAEGREAFVKHVHKNFLTKDDHKHFVKGKTPRSIEAIMGFVGHDDKGKQGDLKRQLYTQPSPKKGPH